MSQFNPVVTTLAPSSAQRNVQRQTVVTPPVLPFESSYIRAGSWIVFSGPAGWSGTIQWDSQGVSYQWSSGDTIEAPARYRSFLITYLSASADGPIELVTGDGPIPRPAIQQSSAGRELVIRRNITSGPGAAGRATVICESDGIGTTIIARSGVNYRPQGSFSVPDSLVPPVGPFVALVTSAYASPLQIGINATWGSFGSDPGIVCTWEDPDPGVIPPYLFVQANDEEGDATWAAACAAMTVAASGALGAAVTFVPNSPGTRFFSGSPVVPVWVSLPAASDWTSSGRVLVLANRGFPVNQPLASLAAGDVYSIPGSPTTFKIEATEGSGIADTFVAA